MRTILAMTWKEMLRKKVMALTLLLTLLFLLGFWFVADTVGQNGFAGGSVNNGSDLILRFTNGSFILNLGFYFGAFVIAFLSIFSSFSVIAGEAEQGVMQALLPRPLPRWKWYFGRWLGFVTLGALYALILFLAILLITSVHANIPRDAAALIKSYLLFTSVVPLLISVSMLGSGLFSALGNGVFMTMLYGAGWLGGMLDKLSGSLRLEGDAMNVLNSLTGIISMLMPADALQRRMIAELLSLNGIDSLVSARLSGFTILNFGAYPSNSFIVYTAGYTVLAFAIGLLRFQHKDL
ncbi:ABC transporter permease subunit [Paenibacillus sp. MMS20-IR301]|uniref:ABC transporter permease subunit n=1 Tax=Paenibacillus sp. MMS20-IR301 TaxID=2895946 RepID=UPI0028E85DDA|nr:ABC transporter permease subunit [Paenibacillus sp. MMS20-IR301]WNS45493.1 ABC transporter permease subunit [Paenibacillus sp. MMS20-IR301]